MLKFKKIELEDLETYQKYTENCKGLSCENSFVNLLVWQCAYNNMMAVCEGLLFIKSGKENKETFRLPIGNDFQKGMDILKKHCGKLPDFWVQEGSRYDKFIANYKNSYNIRESRDAFDYIYLQKDLAELSGKKYHSKRNHISAFSKKFDWRYESITKKNLSDVKLCADNWYKENAHRLDSYMQCEKRGIDIILDNFEVLNIKGGAIFVGEKMVAFTLGSPITNEIFDIHIEKALKDYAESYTIINREFAKNELSDYRYINREDDMGLEGLRKAKLSYKPHILLKKFYCKAEEI